MYLAQKYLLAIFYHETDIILTTFVQFLWLLLGLYYFLTFMGRWFPDLEVWVTTWWTFPLHGCLWISTFLIPGNATPNAMAEIWGGLRNFPFAAVGSWNAILFPVIDFYILFWIRRHRIGLIYYEVSRRERLIETYTKVLYNITSPFIPLLCWEMYFRVNPLLTGYLETDFHQYPGTFSVLFISLLFNGLLWLFHMLMTITFQGHVVWFDYPKKASVICEELGEQKRLQLAIYI